MLIRIPFGYKYRLKKWEICKVISIFILEQKKLDSSKSQRVKKMTISKQKLTFINEKGKGEGEEDEVHNYRILNLLNIQYFIR